MQLLEKGAAAAILLQGPNRRPLALAQPLPRISPVLSPCLLINQGVFADEKNEVNNKPSFKFPHQPRSLRCPKKVHNEPLFKLITNNNCIYNIHNKAFTNVNIHSYSIYHSVVSTVSSLIKEKQS